MRGKTSAEKPPRRLRRSMGDPRILGSSDRLESSPLAMARGLFLIVRLVRNCALGRTIQYAAASRFNHCRQCLLDAPPSRGMTSHDTSLSVAFGALKVLRSVGL
jgi:hypothetical protein